MNTPKIVVIAHNIRSSHNIGSIFRTADGFGAEHLYLSGFTPYPEEEKDSRLPHISHRVTNEISKTALGAEKTVPFSHISSPYSLIDGFKAHGYDIVGLEQDDQSIPLPQFIPSEKMVLILGEEINGISSDLVKKCTQIIEIPMTGQKESYNVSVAAGIALYALSYNPR